MNKFYITDSRPLRNLLETLLAVGNYLNGGLESGQADGYCIDILNKLKEIQDRVCHYIRYEWYMTVLFVDSYLSLHLFKGTKLKFLCFFLS